MSDVLRSLDQLSRQSASDVKNRWRDVVHEVRESGSVAITNHSKVELVLVDAATYQQLWERAAVLKAHEQTVLDELASDFDQRLSVLNQPDASRKMAAVFASRGKLGQRPQAGTSY